MVENKKFDIIMLNMSDYSDWSNRGIVNRNYFILQKFIKSNNVGKVLAVDFMPHSCKRAIKKIITKKYYKTAQKITDSLGGGLYQIEEKLYVYSSIEAICAFFENKMYAKINKIASDLNFKNIILWSYLPTFTKYLKKIDAQIKIFDAVDDWSKHGSYHKIRNKIIQNYEIIDEGADIIFTVSKKLEKLFKNNKNVHWIPNGVDARHFNLKKEKLAMPADIINIRKPIIGYVGIVQERFDIALLEYLLKNNREKSFVVVGAVWPDANINKLKKYPNLNLLGQKKYQDLPQFLNQFDAAIIPHKINEFTDSMNPLKLYEYLAAGKPVVSTKVAGYEKFADLIETADEYEEFNQKLNQVLKSDTANKILLRKKIAQENSWEARINQIFDIINNYFKL